MSSGIVMRVAYVALLSTTSVAIAWPAKARVTKFELADEIAGSKTFYVHVKATSYQEWTNENELRWRCRPDGTVSIMWHTGGEYSGRLNDPSDTQSYRFDNEDVGTVNLAKMDGHISGFYRDALRAKKLVLRTNLGIGGSSPFSSTFHLAGFAAAAGPRSSFGRQCARALGDQAQE